MKNIAIKFITAVVILFALVSCRETKTTEEKVEDAVEQVGDDIEEGAEEIKDEIDDATDDN